MKRLLALLVTALLVVLASAGPAAARQTYPFRDPGLPLDSRVGDLLKRLTLDEKVSLLHQYQPAIPRLGVGAFKTGTEALHGVGWSTDRSNNGAVVTAKGTVFPQAVGLASTWDTELIKRVGAAVGDEARGYNVENPGVWGLQLWAPVVNLLRDPRWGRNEEGYSEDTHLTGEISTAYGSGLQGDDPRHLKTAPVLKHYLANNNEVHRDTTSSQLRPRVKHEYDEAAFKPAISADAATGVMTSYNLVNGRPMTAHSDVDDVVRTWTDQELFNVTDAGAPNGLIGSQNYYPDLPTADAAVLKAGVDSFTTDDTNSAKTIEAIKTALARGLIAESDVDTAVRHILAIRFRLGEFDPGGGPYAKITKDVIDSPANRALARETAGEAVVLLKNQGGTLPLDARKSRKVAVVGPLSDTLYTDWYSGALPYGVTPVDGVKARLGSGGTVTDGEGVDRIALKEVGSGRYVTAGAAADGDVLRIADGGAGATQQFDVFDWGQGVLTLRSAANDRYVTISGSSFVNSAVQPSGWFVQQQFKLEDVGGGQFVIRYAGYEKAYDWSGPEQYLTVAQDGHLTLGAVTAAEAARFTKDVVRDGIADAAAKARAADVAVVVVGSMPFINGREDHDRTDMNLAAGQEALVKAVHAANPNTVVVLENSYPTTVDWEQANVPAMLWTTHAGAETGNALADVLFGDRNPSGHLTQTWYRSAADLPDILDYDIIKSGRTYQYFEGKPLYPFGYGLSYTSFRYDGLKVDSPVVDARGEVKVSVRVTNTGTRAGDEVVQLYTHQQTSRDKQPDQRLRAFDRVHLDPGRSKTVTLTVKAADLAVWDVTRGKWVVENSVQDIEVGASVDDIRQRGSVRVRGETIPARDLAKATRAVDFDDYSGVTLVDESKERGDAVGAAAGQWIRFTDADLGRGAKTFSAKVSRAAAGSASIEVRLGDPVHGEVVGTAAVASTGNVYTYGTTTAALSQARGRQDVYLVFTGDLRVASFSLK
ncbi:glycoside hydrolase family 3 C-terminal domain-containing protein [Umezawaea sp. Da 62-37]|uniref:glycoside hydrolase family 3 protein n=1 Tax=Umezawaea sp. Da 62-37 TaxID=3075927 RepID=UPI0028F74272|nr:glycoside hydrolase family 3 C-terminal domain-containing protein [Umezawaea sp. Da 62-37]WNV88454.1 glycoside hydrolase family 3 C-terminal domain-containing protein [Umezawaea sp. Da 62-37]